MHRIDIIICELNQSGASNASLILANAIAENGMPARIIAIGKESTPPFPLHKNLEIKFLGIQKSDNLPGDILYFIRCYFILSTYLAKEKSRRIFSWGKEFTALLAFIRITLPLPFKLIGVNTSISLNNHFPVSSILNWIFSNFLNKPELIIAQSSGIAEELTDIYNIPENKLTIIYLPLQQKFFNLPAEKNKTGKILFVGKATKEKDFFTALEIFKNLENKNATLQFAGDDELEIPLKEQVTELDLQSRVSFAGRQDDILPFLHNADVLILTSNYEGFGMILAEAIACGTPVVSFDYPTGASEIIIDGINGYLVPQDNIDMFTKKLNLALTKKWDHKKITETANKFHPDIAIKRYLEVIKKEFGLDNVAS